MLTEVKRILIYTDGACEPNPGGPGGYGAILEYKVDLGTISTFS